MNKQEMKKLRGGIIPHLLVRRLEAAESLQD